MFLMHYANLWLCRSAELARKYTTHSLALYYLGPLGSTVTKLFIAFGNWLFVVNIIQIFADLWYQLLLTNSFISNRTFGVVVGLLIILPFVAVKNMSKLEGLSVVCMVFCMLVVVVLFINCTKAIAYDSISPTFSWGAPDAFSFFYGLASVSWSWCVQYNTLPIYITLHREVREEAMG